MPATTPGGLPYPLPSDPIADGATQIQALAEAVEADTNTLATSVTSLTGMLRFQPQDFLTNGQFPSTVRFPPNSFTVFQVTSTTGGYPRTGTVFAIAPTGSQVVELLIPTNMSGSTIGPCWRAGNSTAQTWEPWRKLADDSTP
jgi:hypothetical protein